MKTIIKQQILVMLIFLIVFQSCATYYDNSFHKALNKAYFKHKAIEITTINGAKINYQNIVANQDLFYGIKNKNLLPDSIPINVSNIKGLKLKNRTVLNTLEFMGIIVLVGAIIVFWVDSGFDFNYEN